MQRRKNFAGGHEGVALELMAFVECGPSGLSSLLRFRVFSSKLVQATLPVIGKGWVNKFWGSGGFDPRPPKIFGRSIHAEIGSERSECYTDAGKFEKLTTKGL